MVVVFGILTVYGFFNLSDGKAQLIGSSKVVNTEVDVHNHIVDYVHSIGVGIRDLNILLRDFETTSDIDLLKEEIDKFIPKTKSLEKYMAKNSFKRNKQIIEETFSQQYLPAVTTYENTFKKLFAYTSAKPLDETSLNSFKNSTEKAFNNYMEVHNTFVEELNRVRRY